VAGPAGTLGQAGTDAARGTLSAGAARGRAGLARIALGHFFPETHGLTDDWYLHTTFFAVFLFGFVFLANPRIIADFAQLRWLALAIGLAAYVSHAAYVWHYRDGAAIPIWLKVTMALVYGFDQWAWLTVAFGFAWRWLGHRDGPARRYLTEAVFPYYIIHQTAIVVVAYRVAKLGLPIAVEAAVVIGGCVLTCVLTFELVRRVEWLRPLFGLKAQRNIRTHAVGREPPERAAEIVQP
jgi:hypothetical protein